MRKPHDPDSDAAAAASSTPADPAAKSSPFGVRFDASRRRLLTTLAAGTAGAATLAACHDHDDDRGGTAGGASGGSGGTGGGTTPGPETLPAPADTGIDHVVVVMMENRSFDHYFGWLAGADGQQAGLTFKDKAGNDVSSFHLASTDGYGYQSCGQEDPDHSYDGGRTHYNGGRNDGWLGTVGTSGDHFPVGYFQADDLPFFKGMAENFTICDRYFSGILSSTYPNRMYMHTGQTDRLTNTSTSSTLPAIWDRLNRAGGPTGTYYYSDIPFTALFGSRFLSISQPLAAFMASAAAGTLPNVSFIDPGFAQESSGTSNDDHPLADVRDGQAFLNSIYEALRTGPRWSRTLLVINYDEWGGFYDHVPPPLAPVSAAEAALGSDGRLGFRVPCVLVGPRARKAHVEHAQFDPNSILNFICWRFGLEPLAIRGRSSTNLAHALDFATAPRTDAPAIADVGRGPFGRPCMLSTLLPGQSINELTPTERTAAEHQLDLETLRVVARRSGFAL